MTVDLLCPVRGCGETLERSLPAWRCPRGHSFDVARSGYCNLLQPQDRRSARPGDPPQAVAARRRLIDAGLASGLHATLRRELASLDPGMARGLAVLDVGCGEGSFLGAGVKEEGWEGHGIDLALPAIELAARRFPAATWIVANADRALPQASASFDFVVSIDARLPVAELHRVLKPTGWLLVAVPAPDDLIELRALVLGAQGEGEGKERLSAAGERLASHFALERRGTERSVVDLTPALATDLLLATYRAGRTSRAGAIAGLPALQVTTAHDFALFRPRSGPAPPDGQR